MSRWPLLLCTLLVACTGHGDPKPSAKQAAAAYLEIHNEWHPEAARALWGEKASTYEQQTYWFRDQVGPCNGFSTMHIKSEMQARFAFKCDRGELEIAFSVDEASGLVKGILWGARGVEPPAAVRQMAEQVVKLANGEPAAEPVLVGKLDSAKFHEELDEISEHGCRIDRVHLGHLRAGRFILECAHGSMTMLVQLDQQGALQRFAVDNGAADTWRLRD